MTNITVTIGKIATALAITKRSAERRAGADAWPYSTQSGIGGQRRLYAIDALPLKVQAAINTHLAIERAKEHTGSEAGAISPEPTLPATPNVAVATPDVAHLPEPTLPATPNVAVATPDVAPSFPAFSGETTQAGLPSPADSSPAAAEAARALGF